MLSRLKNASICTTRDKHLRGVFCRHGVTTFFNQHGLGLLLQYMWLSRCGVSSKNCPTKTQFYGNAPSPIIFIIVIDRTSTPGIRVPDVPLRLMEYVSYPLLAKKGIQCSAQHQAA